MALLLLASAWALLYTQAGANLVLGVAVRATDEALSYSSAEGSLAGGIVVADLRFVTPTASVSADRARLRAMPGLVPLALDVYAAELHELEIIVEPAAEPAVDAKPVDVTAVIEALALPLVLRFHDLDIAVLKVLRGDDSLLELDRIGLAATWGDRLSVERLEATGSMLALSGSASLALQQPFAVEAGLSSQIEAGLFGTPRELSPKLNMSGNLDELNMELSDSGWGVDVRGDLTNVLTTPGWRLNVRASEFDPGQDLQFSLRNAVADTGGSIDDYWLRANLLLDVEAAGTTNELAVSLVARGSHETLEIESAQLDHDAGGVHASGSLTIPSAFSGSIAAESFDLNRLTAAWPSGHPLSASAQLEATPDSVSIRSAELAIVNTPTRLGFDALVDLGSGQIRSDVEWRNLRWPPAGNAENLASPEGTARIRGRVDDWQAESTMLLAAEGFEPGRLTVVATGSDQDVEVDIVEGAVLGGSVDGAAAIRFGETLAWSANLAVGGLDTGALVSRFPGRISADIAADGNVETGRFRLGIDRIEGEVRGKALSGGGEIRYADGLLEASDFRVAHGDANVSLDGSIYDTGGIEFELDAPDLSVYGAWMSGDITAAGNARLVDGLALVLDARSSLLRFGDFQVDELSATTDGETDSQLRIHARADRTSFGARSIEDIELTSAVGEDRQAVDLALRSLGHRVSLAMSGAFEDPMQPATSKWIGEVTKFDFADPDGAVIGDLSSAVPVSLSSKHVRIDSFCLGNEADNSLCAELAWERDGELALNAEAHQLPLNIVNVFADTGFRLEHLLSGVLRWNQASGKPASGSADIRVSGGSIRSARFPNLDLRTDPGEFSFEILRGTLLSGKLELPMLGAGFVTGEFSLDDIRRGTSAEVRGFLRSRIEDIDVIAALLPNIENAGGTLAADLELKGTLGEPVAIGKASLENGSLEYFPLGLVLSDIDLTGVVDESRNIDLEGRFRAGEGHATVRTSRSKKEDELPGLHFEISGDDLALINLPDVEARASTDIELDFRGQRLDVNGTIDVPYARIWPQRLPQFPVGESDDVVIIAGELPDADGTSKRQSQLEVHGQLSLGIGDDVQVRLDVARASLSGRADFEWTGDAVPVGRGRYDLAGTVQAFGQVLNISEGAIRFPDVPANDPTVRIRATREIYGNSQVKHAGVLVDGSLRRPTVTAYTYPATTEERALTLLVTGNDFDFEQGVGAVDFGIYIAPKLFMSYGVGVFEQTNIISLRYDFRRNLGIRATSGEKQSGLDLTYSIER